MGAGDAAATERRGRLVAQRLALPDQPGVYLFRDRRGRVIYVGKAKSVRKRVASHFAGRTAYGETQLVSMIDHIDCVVTATETEALLTEQTFIKQYKPRFNIRLRDDKSYPFIAISLDEDFPRVYFTRERHKRERVYFGPYSNAKKVRETLDLLQKMFLFRSCEGPEPGRRSGSPCLDFYIKRCEAPCVDKVSKAHYREMIDGVIAFLEGRYREIERQIEGRMRHAAERQLFEQAALERDRLNSVRSLLERQGVANESVGTLDAIAIAIDGADANAQVFQVRDGVLADRQGFYLRNEARRGVVEVAEEFMLQYYVGSSGDPGGSSRIPQQLVVQAGVGEGTPLAEALAARRGGAVELRRAERGDKRRILDLAQRNAVLALEQERLRDTRRKQDRVEALHGLQRALGLAKLPMRIECYDISNLYGSDSVASMVVFEGGVPKKSDYRRFRIKSVDGPNDYASIEEVLARRFKRWKRYGSGSTTKPDPSFSTLPNLVVIDGGKGQLSSALRVLGGFTEQGVAVVSLAKRIEEVFFPGSSIPLVLDHHTPELQLLQRVRDEAHRFAVSHHRVRRDSTITDSVFDGLRGIGPTRKRSLLKHFGSPEAVLAATREQLEAVPGVPPKVGRDIYAALNRTNR